MQADAGIVRADRAIQVMAKMVKKHGGEVIEQRPVRLIDLTNSGATVTTDDATYHCSKLIITTGAWAAPFSSKFGAILPLTVTQEQYAFFEPAKKENFEVGTFPVFVHFNSDEPREVTCHYGFPLFGRAGVKVADEQTPGVVTTANARSFEIDQQRLKQLTDYVHTVLPDAYGKIIHATTCLYTRTPDEDFIIDKLPGYPQVVVASACSGHGFKFASVTGRILADLAETGATNHPIEMFSISRF